MRKTRRRRTRRMSQSRTVLLTIRSPDLSRAVDTMAVEGRGVQTQAILQYYQGDLWYYTLRFVILQYYQGDLWYYNLRSTILLVLLGQKSIYVPTCNAQHTITCMTTAPKAWAWCNTSLAQLCAGAGVGMTCASLRTCFYVAVCVFLCIIFMKV